MPGIVGLRKTQLGPEATAGTAVAATSIWRGPSGDIDDTREIEFVPEHTGYLSGQGRTNVTRLGAEYALPSTEATYQQLLHVLQAGIALDASPEDDGTGSGKIWSFVLPTTSQNTPKTYTLEVGDNQQAYEMEYSFVREFTLSGNKGEALMVESTWEGRQKTATTFTPALSVIPVSEINMGTGKVWLDDSAGTVGTTAVSDTMLGINLSLTTGFQSVATIDSGVLYFSYIKQIPPELELQVTMEYNATAVAEYNKWLAQSTRLLRIQFEGQALTTPDTYSKETFRVDLSGKWQDFDILGDEDGNDVITATFKPFYSATDALFVEMLLVNEIAAL